MRVPIIALLAGCWSGASPQPASPRVSPSELATDWVRALLAGDAPRAMQLSAVPFSFDRKRIDSPDELRTALVAAAAKAGGKNHRIAGAAVAGGDLSPHFAIPVAGHVGVRVTLDREGILVLVRPDPPRVVGFRD